MGEERRNEALGPFRSLRTEPLEDVRRDPIFVEAFLVPGPSHMLDHLVLTKPSEIGTTVFSFLMRKRKPSEVSKLQHHADGMW